MFQWGMHTMSTRLETRNFCISTQMYCIVKTQQLIKNTVIPKEIYVNLQVKVRNRS